MLVGNKIHGNASTAVNNRALACVNWLATQSTAVQDMLARQDILLLVMVTVGAGDQDTVVKWQANKTRITVSVYVAQQDPPLKLEQDLLHELILHAEPATEKHLAAVNNQTAPDYPSDDSDIEAEEAAEHRDVNRWYRVAVIARANGMGLLERAIADAAAENTVTATTLLQRLANAHQITADQARELQEDLVDV